MLERMSSLTLGDLSGVHERMNTEVQRNINQHLGLPPSTLPLPQRATQLLRYRQFLNSISNQHEGIYQQTTLADLQSSIQYKHWRAARSSLLVLHGSNHPSVPNISQSWLSLAAMDLVNNLLNDDVPGGIVCWHICSNTETLEYALSQVMSQLMGSNPTVLRRESTQQLIESSLVPPRDSDDSGDDEEEEESEHASRTRAVRSQRKVLEGRLDAMAAFIRRCRGRPVYLVIDRPEQCTNASDGNMWRFVRRMLQLVTGTASSNSESGDESGVELRVLMVVRKEFWNVEDRISSLAGSELGPNGLKPGQFLVLRRDQDYVHR